MDGSKDQPHLTAALDIGDKYSYLCLIDTHSGEVLEEGRLRTTPETFLRRLGLSTSITEIPAALR